MKYLRKLCWCSLAEPPRFAGVPPHLHTREWVPLWSTKVISTLCLIKSRVGPWKPPPYLRIYPVQAWAVHTTSWHFAGSCHDHHSLLAIKMAAVPFPFIFFPPDSVSSYCLLCQNKDPSPRDNLIAIPMLGKWAKQIRGGGQRPDMPSSTPAPYSAPKEMRVSSFPVCSIQPTLRVDPDTALTLIPLLFAMSFHWETPTPAASTTITSLHTWRDEQHLWAFRAAIHTPT